MAPTDEIPATPPTAGPGLLAPVGEGFREVIGVLRRYRPSTARADLIAGATVAVVAIPQSMAYAIIAGVPPIYGLYTLIFQGLIAAPLSSHPLLAAGPVITQSLLVASIITRIEGSADPQTYLGLVIGLTLIKGLMQIAMALVHLGDLVKYVSQSVIVGFTSGAAILIAASQVPEFFGFTAPRVDQHLEWPGLIGYVQRFAPYWQHFQPLSILMGLLALGLLLGARWYSRLAPGPLLALLVTAGLVYLIGWDPAHLRLMRPISVQWPLPRLPELAHLESLLAGALAMSLMGLLEGYAIARTLSGQTGGRRVGANRELLSQGVTHTLTSFLACIPGSVSFSRSALNAYAGAQTFLANVFGALLVALALLLLAPVASYIPMAAIAAILMVIAWSLIDLSYFRRAAISCPADLAVCLGTLAATLCLPLKYAVFLGVALNLALYLRRASDLQIQEMLPTQAGPFVELPLDARSGSKAVVFLQMEGSLFFAVADTLDDRLQELVHSPVRVVVMRLKRTHWIDATVLGVLERFIQQMHARQKHVVLCGLRPEMMQQLEAFGLVALLGKKNVFPTGIGVFASAKRGLDRARVLLGESIDTDAFVPEADEAVD